MAEENKTNFYLIAIVAIVAIVGLFVMFKGSGTKKSELQSAKLITDESSGNTVGQAAQNSCSVKCSDGTSCSCEGPGDMNVCHCEGDTASPPNCPGSTKACCRCI